MQATHETYMRLALAQARLGLGRTAPNPAVGAVVVAENKVLGKGYHQRAGGPHAEINALAAAAAAGANVRGASIYVTLEPCNHTGATPPCTEALLGAGIARVIIGAMDPNPQVLGGGAARLAAAGIEVIRGICEQECQRLILPFVKRSLYSMPWVICKAALSLDGRLSASTGRATRLSSARANQAAHQLRNQVDAILIGIETALVDNPRLNTRLREGSDCHDPIRIILDSSLRLPCSCRLLQQHSTAATWIFCREDAELAKEQRLIDAGAAVFRTPAASNGSGLDLSQVLRQVGQRGVTSLLVEGGSRVHGSFWSQQLIDELYLVYTPFLLGDQAVPFLSGLAPCEAIPTPLPLLQPQLVSLGPDFLFQALLTAPASLFPASAARAASSPVVHPSC